MKFIEYMFCIEIRKLLGQFCSNFVTEVERKFENTCTDKCTRVSCNQHCVYCLQIYLKLSKIFVDLVIEHNYETNCCVPKLVCLSVL